jgi:hypothetical protein
MSAFVGRKDELKLLNDLLPTFLDSRNNFLELNP